VSLNVVIVGAVACGPKAGCRLKRLVPEAKVTMIDRDDLISYGGCGIPYYVSGDVPDLKGLLNTSFHMTRDPAFFKGAKGIDVLTRTEATAIDRERKVVLTKNLDTGVETELAYDKLVLATGSRPHVPPVPGADLPGVFPVGNLHHAEAIKQLVAQGQVGTAAVIGAGATGLEMAEAMADLWGIETHVFEMAPHILPGVLDADLARMVEEHLLKNEINLHFGHRIERFEGDSESVTAIVTDQMTLDVDLVIMATGVRPNGELAAAAGLLTDERGAIVVDDRMRTSDPDIYAGGDCVANRCLVTGGTVYVPAGSLANRHGRVIGTNLAGGEATFPGVAGSFVIKLFGLGIAKVGLGLERTAEAGLDAVGVLVVQADKAHFYPDFELMYLKMIVEPDTRRVLGLMGICDHGDILAGRISAVAALMPHRPTITEISNLEVPYAPPFASAMDILNATANTAENLIEGRLKDLSPEEFSQLLAERDLGQWAFIDVRAIDNAAPYLAALAPHWMHFPQEKLDDLMDKLPPDKKLVLICNSGVRSYEAMRQLAREGRTDTYNLAGGVAAVKKWGEGIIPPAQDDGSPEQT
jgi:NADPH-dependent 2,4-dienoyl-CoA reductase/sulfur reductase-like enzyme/rhodanese-related sulfurtransferase